MMAAMDLHSSRMAACSNVHSMTEVAALTARSCHHVPAAMMRRHRGVTRHVAVPSSASQNGAFVTTQQLVTLSNKPSIEARQAVPILEENVSTRFIAETLLPTRHGKFRVRGYKHSIDGGLTFTEPTAIISGVVEGQENVPLRVHDACFTSEVLGSLKCDCAEQLSLALQMIYNKPPGIVIYLQQEGRGIGLANKIAAYSLQERGLDTVDANRALGLPDDCREYTSVRNIVKDLGIKSIQLITNNPRKIKELTALGINISGRMPCIVQDTNEHNKGYLEAKRDRMDHLLDGSFCHWDHGGEPTQPTPTAAAKGGMGLPNNLSADSDGRVVVNYQIPDAPAGSNGGVVAHSNGNGLSNGNGTSNGNGVASQGSSVSA